MEDSYNDNGERENGGKRFSLRGLFNADGAVLPALLCALCLGIALWETVRLLFF